MKISNDLLSVEAKLLGAELNSIRNIVSDREYLWSADPEVWPRKAPVLFPIVGGLKDNKYLYEDDPYTLSRHGFARDSEFEVSKWNPGEMEFALRSSLKTYPGYPFDFDFRVGYRLDGTRLTQSFKVKNTGEESMPFSVGAHPAFQCEPIEEYFLEFEEEEKNPSDTIDEQGLRTGEERAFFAGKQIQLDAQIFDRDALIFKDLRSKHVALKHQSGSTVLRMSLEGFPYLGIWAKPGADFVCIEPWVGVADANDHNQKVEEKEGIIWLQPEESMSWEIHMDFTE